MEFDWFFDGRLARLLPAVRGRWSRLEFWRFKAGQGSFEQPCGALQPNGVRRFGFSQQFMDDRGHALHLFVGISQMRMGGMGKFLSHVGVLLAYSNEAR